MAHGLAEGDMPPSDKLDVFVADPQLKGPNQTGIGGGQSMDRSVYLSVCRRDISFAPKAYYPLYKVDISGDSSSLGAPAARERPRRIGELRTDVGGKTFVSLPSGWIIGVGGEHGGTIIVDTKAPTSTPKVIHGPNLLAGKWSPVVAAVGCKVYALSRSPSYIREPDFFPWFEVLDLSKGTVTETADGSFSLDGCFWEELPCPPIFPHKLSPRGYLRPPIITVRSYVVVLPYILISLNEKTRCTYAFDTNSGEWHKIDDKCLPFVGLATPHGHNGCIFLGSSLENGSIEAYRIRVSTSSISSSEAGVSGMGSALKLSIAVLLIKHKAHEQVGSMAGQYVTSLDMGRFAMLSFWPDNRKRSMRYYDDTNEEVLGSYSRKLFTKLKIYQIENPALLEETEDQEKLQPVEATIAISTQQEQEFKFSSSYGFSSPLISFALSV
ncbi:hypothetical protein EJB05_18480 [Eragrostis curvula]|uniref:Uncharacterized protein n=1 Tax=Eragrostis curvula TaxID=38414 RepID=A0A5J9VK84_9POAL|nr:hypothetical protein EJB05_18480 [Eragrostis curvula]